MGKITANQKLQLIRSIREESLDNRMKMRHRERLLYGTESKTGDEMPLYSKGYYGSGEKELYALEEGGIPVTGNSLSSFKIRLVLGSRPFLRVSGGRCRRGKDRGHFYGGDAGRDE